MYTDRRGKPYSLAIGMSLSVTGLGLLSIAHNFGAPSPRGSASSASARRCSIPNPPAWRGFASGGRHGLAQSLFQVGGNFGQAIGPLLAAFIVLPHGQGSVAWFTAAGILALVLLIAIGNWFRGAWSKADGIGRHRLPPPPHVSAPRVIATLAVLMALMFSKFVYVAALSKYYTFYLISTFGTSVRDAQIYLFVYLGAFAAGTFLGGPIGDRFGRKYVIWGFDPGGPHLSLWHSPMPISSGAWS
jgi:FSR family fosmidomycin resistance protein-like MFS transporter